jgi:hypothetical protein
MKNIGGKVVGGMASAGGRGVGRAFALGKKVISTKGLPIMKGKAVKVKSVY